MRSWSRFAFLFVVLLLLSACKVELYSGLDETEANQMMALLMANDIDVKKSVVADTGVTLSVDQEDLLRSINILKNNGYPKNARVSLGKAFEKSGIISSPFEERVRFIYALGEEISQTLNQIDGVLTARVHIVLPEAPQLGQPIKPSSASVFIKHSPGTDLDFLIPQIKRLVSNAIEGLDYSAVSVIMVEAAPAKEEAVPAKKDLVTPLPGLMIDKASEGRLWQFFYLAGGLVFLLLIAVIAFAVLWLRSKTPGVKTVETTSVVTSPSLVEPS